MRQSSRDRANGQKWRLEDVSAHTRPIGYGWMAKVMAPWLTAGAMLVSFTASAGYAPDQLSVQQSFAPFPPSSLEEAPVPLVARPWQGMFAAEGLPDDVDWMARPDFVDPARTLPASRTPPRIAYQRSVPVLMTNFGRRRLCL